MGLDMWRGLERRRPRARDRRAHHSELWNVAVWLLFAMAWFLAGFVTARVTEEPGVIVDTRAECRGVEGERWYGCRLIEP